MVPFGDATDVVLLEIIGGEVVVGRFSASRCAGRTFGRCVRLFAAISRR